MKFVQIGDDYINMDLVMRIEIIRDRDYRTSGWRIIYVSGVPRFVGNTDSREAVHLRDFIAANA